MEDIPFIIIPNPNPHNVFSEFVNNLIKQEISKNENLVLFGQNINAGSCLGGLTKGLLIGNYF